MSEQKTEIVTKAVRDRAAAAARDELVFSERRARDAANRAQTERLRALRLAHEATLQIC